MRSIAGVAISSFNTQPPEGGWLQPFSFCNSRSTFQHTAARRRLEVKLTFPDCDPMVSTHSRPKAAGTPLLSTKFNLSFQHTAARRRLANFLYRRRRRCSVSTHSRPKAAGSTFGNIARYSSCCFNTQPPEGGWFSTSESGTFCPPVSTHSRPKAAGYSL